MRQTIEEENKRKRAQRRKSQRREKGIVNIMRLYKYLYTYRSVDIKILCDIIKLYLFTKNKYVD